MLLYIVYFIHREYVFADYTQIGHRYSYYISLDQVPNGNFKKLNSLEYVLGYIYMHPIS